MGKEKLGGLNMTYPEFMTAIENYYGKYKNEMVEDMILKFIKSAFGEDELSNLFTNITLDYSNQYKTPPDISKFYDIVKMKVKQKAIIAWGKAKDVNGINAVFFDDKLIHFVIENLWGSLERFINARDGKNWDWVRKDFVTMYIDSYGRNVQHKPLDGLYSKTIKFIGDEKKCIELLKQNNKKNYIDNPETAI